LFIKKKKKLKNSLKSALFDLDSTAIILADCMKEPTIACNPSSCWTTILLCYYFCCNLGSQSCRAALTPQGDSGIPGSGIARTAKDRLYKNRGLYKKPRTKRYDKPITS